MSTPTYPYYDLPPASVKRFSEASQPAPWSQVNTRLEYDEFVEFRAEELPQARHTHITYMNGIPLRPKESTDSRLLLSNAEPDPHTSLLRAPSILSPTLTSLSADVVRCEQCHVAFTGAYAKGNLRRHLQHKHALVKAVSYRCKVSGCDKTFARKDARLKHARKHHPSLHSEPIRRKQDNEAVATSIPRKVNGGSTPCRRSDDRSARTNRGSGLHTARTYTRVAHTTTSIGSKGQYFQQIGHINQKIGAAIPADHIEARSFQCADHNGLSAAIIHQETRSSPQDLQPPRADWRRGQVFAPTTVTGYHSSTGMSAQPSSQGFGTSPSSYFHPVHTESTTVHSLEDSIIQSPLTSPYSHHPITLQSGASPHITPYDTLISQESLSEDYIQAIHGCDTSIDLSHIDPVLFQQPFEWPSSLDEELG